MAKTEAHQPFSGFGIGLLPKEQSADSIFLLAVYRDGALTAAAYATERSAMAAALAFLEGDGNDDEEERGGLEDRFIRVQQMISEEGGAMEIIESPVHGN